MRTEDINYIKNQAEAILKEVKKEYVDSSYILEKSAKIQREIERQERLAEAKELIE